VTDLPRWTRRLLWMVASPADLDDVLGDLEEAHHRHKRRHRRLAARALTALETFDMAGAIVRARVARSRIRGSSIVQDYKLGLRMLLKYPGLTVAGGLALAIAIGVGAGWYDLTRDLLRPSLPLPGGDRLVEIEMRDSASGQDERRILHDFVGWRRDAQLTMDLGAYRTLERNLMLGDARPEPVTTAETTASAFTITRVPPLLGRPLVAADEVPGAPPVVVLGYSVWRRQFEGRADVVGQVVQLGSIATTVVGVMPEGFAFPVNHRIWVPLQVRPSGYAPLEGPAIHVFGRLAPGATQAQAYAELTTLTQRAAAASPITHEHLRPRVLAYGGESPGDRSWLEFVVTHLPILMVLLVACANVGTLIYARTATREAEIATRLALGASRARIVSQLFVEALMLAGVAATVGLVVAHWALKWGVATYYSGESAGVPFWIHSGLRATTVVYAAGLTIVGAALLGLLPALKVTRPQAQPQLRSAGGSGSSLRFGFFWTAAMIGQVALTVICLPPAMGIAHEAWRDRVLRDQFPAERYLAVRLDLDADLVSTTGSVESAAARRSQVYEEFERRLLAESGVEMVTLGDRLPGMAPGVRSGEVEITPNVPPLLIPSLWTAAVGPRYFETFDIPVVAGRDFHDGDRAELSRTVMVNEAFVRRYMDGANPVGTRVRYATADASRPEPWFEIVGVVRDVGMTPTDLGEAPYLFRAVSAATASPLVVGVRTAADPSALAPRIRAITSGLDPGIRLDEVRSLDELVRRVDIPMMIGAGAILTVVALGLCLSAAGIFALMSVRVSRQTREIGLRAALGASRGRVLAGIFSKAAVLVGSGVLAGDLVLMFFVSMSDEVALSDVSNALLITSSIMLTVGLLACVEPARRALRIQPGEALKEA